MRSDQPASPWPGRLIVIGLGGCAVSLLGGIAAPVAFFAAYLVGFLFCLSVSLGSLAVVMLGHLVGGRWAVATRRPLEAATRTLPVVALLALPILVGLRALYPWALPGTSPHPLYLGRSAFLVRLLLYFGIWIVLARRMNRVSRLPGNTVQLRATSAGGLILYVLTVSLAMVDWVMTLYPHWSSTIFGLFFVVGQGLAGFALAALVMAPLSRQADYAAVTPPQVRLDVGNLLLTMVSLWAYLQVSQLIVIWSGNLPEEISWYQLRIGPGWQAVTVFVAIGELVVPLAVLLFRSFKRDRVRLAGLGAFLLVMRLLDLYWQVLPAFVPHRLPWHWLLLAVPLALAVLWSGLFLRELGRRPLVPPLELQQDLAYG